MKTTASVGSRREVDRKGAPRRWIGRAILSMGALSIAALAGPLPASAQTKEELAKARVLFMEGVALASGNNCSGAIAKYKEVARVKMTPQVAFNIAECEERLGKLVSALGNYRLVQQQLEDPKERAKAKDVASRINARVSSLEERIPKLTITRGKGAATAVLILDGTELGSSQVGTEMQVDPGPHEVVAKIGEREASREDVTLAEKEAKSIEVVIKAQPKVEESKEPDQVAPPPVTVEPDKGRSIVPGAVLTGVGVAGLAAGAVLFFGPRQSTINELDVLCGGDTTCPKSAEATSDKGRLYTGIAEVSAGVGFALVTTGIILMALSGKKKAPADKPLEETALLVDGAFGRVGLSSSSPGADKGGLSIRGRF